MSWRMDKISSLGMPMQPPRNIQKVQASKLGDAPEAPPSSSAKIRSPFKTLYFYCFMHYAFFLERQLLLFSVFFCFVFCNKCLDHIMYLLEKLPRFSFAKNALVFTLIKNRVFFFFCNCFWFLFSPWFAFRSPYIYLSRYIFASDLYWFFIKRGVYKKFEWC
jgi:hypothetical protein